MFFWKSSKSLHFGKVKQDVYKFRPCRFYAPRYRRKLVVAVEKLGRYAFGNK